MTRPRAVTLPSLEQFDLSVWTPIATQDQLGGPWIVLEGSPMNVRESVAMENKGIIFRAQRKKQIAKNVIWELVVKKRRGSQ